MTKRNRIQIGATLPPDLIAQLRETARQNNRSLSAEMERAIRQYLEDQDASQLPPELLQAIETWYKDNEKRLR